MKTIEEIKKEKQEKEAKKAAQPKLIRLDSTTIKSGVANHDIFGGDLVEVAICTLAEEKTVIETKLGALVAATTAAKTICPEFGFDTNNNNFTLDRDVLDRFMMASEIKDDQVVLRAYNEKVENNCSVIYTITCKNASIPPTESLKDAPIDMDRYEIRHSIIIQLSKKVVKPDSTETYFSLKKDKTWEEIGFYDYYGISEQQINDRKSPTYGNHLLDSYLQEENESLNPEEYKKFKEKIHSLEIAATALSEEEIDTFLEKVFLGDNHCPFYVLTPDFDGVLYSVIGTKNGYIIGFITESIFYPLFKVKDIDELVQLCKTLDTQCNQDEFLMPISTEVWEIWNLNGERIGYGCMDYDHKLTEKELDNSQLLSEMRKYIIETRFN